MLAHQPGHQGAVVRIEAVALAEQRGVLGAQRGVVAAAPLADVVEQAGDVEQFDLRQPPHHARRQRKALVGAGLQEAAHLPQHHHGVGVHRVDVEEVVLHLADDLPELRDVASEHAVAPHSRQLAHQRVGCAQQFEEARADAGVAAEFVVDQMQMLAHQANGGGAHAGDVAAVGHQHEQLHQRRRMRGEDVLAGRLDVVVVDAEALVDRLDARPLAGAGAENRFVEVLQQDVVHLAQQQDVAVVVVHEALHRQLRIRVVVAEALGEFALVVEQQAVLAPTGDDVQAEAYAPQKAPPFEQPLTLQPRQEAALHQLGELRASNAPLGRSRSAQVPLSDPEHRLYVAQAAWGALDVGFEVVVDVVELPVAFLLLLLLGVEEAAAWPEGALREQLVELRGQPCRTGQPSSFQHRRGDADILQRLAPAVGQRAHAVPDVQPQIPQQTHERGDLLLHHAGLARQDQQVDVRVRMQFAAPVAAHGEQRQLRVVLEPVLPDLSQKSVDEARSLGKQPRDVLVGPEAHRKGRIGLPDASPQILHVELRGRRRLHAKSSSARSVSTSTPSAVTSSVCSHCADSL